MVTVEAITRGITNYLDYEILPQLPQGKAVMAGTVAALYLRQAPALIERIPESMNLRRGNTIDLDALRDAVKSQMKSEVPIDIPFIGRFTIDSDEVDKIYRYIMSEQ